jgi:hypothetical protein
MAWRLVEGCGVKAGRLGDFPPGALVFRPLKDNVAGELQIGVRVGPEAEIYCLSDWFGGSYAIHDLLTVEDAKLTFWGFSPQNEPVVAVSFDISGALHPEPSVNDTSGGYLSLNAGGVRLHARSRRRDAPRAQVAIDPVTWLKIASSTADPSAAWLANWSLTARVGEAELCRVEVDYAPRLSGRPASQADGKPLGARG